jgi:Fur family iron response transcriptional regulator
MFISPMSNLLPLQAVLNARASVPAGDAAAGRRGCPLSDLRDRLRRAGLRPTRQRLSLGSLHQFTEAGLLRQLALDGSKAYFDTNPSEHHHFFLEDEGQVLDMPDCGITVDSLPEAPEGMEIAGVEVIVRLRRRGPVARKA